MAGYDPSAANEYNQLIQQGLDPEEAAQMAGIAPEDLGNYTEVNGQLTQNDGPPVDNTNAGFQTDYGTTYDEFGSVVPSGPPTYAAEVNPYDPGTTFDVPAVTPPTQQATVNPASDPNQFPAYDDEGNLMPGYAIDPEFGQVYYAGFTKTTSNVTTTTASTTSLGTTPPATPAVTPPTTSTTANVTTRSLGTTPPATPAVTPPTQQANVNDPYYGLTPQQISALGNADPTDPYIRARLGIPQLSNSPLAATPGFGNIKTGVPLLDSALSILGGLFTTTGPATTQAAVPAQAATTGNGTSPVTITALGPPTALTEVNPYDPGTTFDVPAPTGPGTTDAAVPSPTDYGTTYDEFGAVVPVALPTQDTAVASPTDYGTTYDAFGGVISAAPTQLAEVNPYDPGITFDAPVETPIDSGLTILSEEETNALFAGTDANLINSLVPPPTDNPALLDTEQTDTLYPVIDTGETTAIENRTSVSDSALSDPAISQQLALDADPLPVTSNVTTTDLIDAEADFVIPDLVAQDQDPEVDPELPQPTTTPVVQNDTAIDVDVENDPELSAPVIDEGAPTLVPDEVDPFVDEELPQVQDPETVDWYDAGNVDPNVDPELDTAIPDEGFPTQSAEDVDPLTDEELAAQDAALQDAALTDMALEMSPTDIDPAEDADLAAQDAALQDQALTDMVLEMSPEDVDAASDEELQQQVEDANARDNAGSDWYDAGNVDYASDPGLPQPAAANPASALFGGAGPGDAEAATKLSAKNQATLQARYKQPSTTDWRVRLVLAQNSDYLYNALESEGGAGILAPLKAENGVIFPYTPNITMNYQANYDQYDLTHSNYRGIFYKNSRAGDIQLRCTFTAQDTQEANYLLAVIHFFRSVTKMFYGQDSQRGTPPPLVYLLGFGDFQFSGHPCVVSAFNYNLPNEVDYIRAVAPNNYGTNLLNRRTPVQSAPGGTNFAGAIRLANALLNKGAIPQIPGLNGILTGVNNTSRATYVPTKMELDITLIPVQTRSQISKQFSLKDFANGNLIKGGYW